MSRLAVVLGLTALLLCASGATAGRLDTLTISPPGDITVAATGPCGSTYCATVSYSFSVSGGTPPYTLVCNLPSGSQFTVGSHTVSCLAQDSVGDSTPSASFTVTVKASGDGAGTGGGSPGSGSGHSGSGGGRSSGGGGSSGGSGSSAGGSSSVGGGSPPTRVADHARLTVPATSGAGAVVRYAVPNGGLHDPGAVVACRPASGSTFPLGRRGATRTTVVTCRISDSAGRITARRSFTVTVLGGGSQLATLEHSVDIARALTPAERRALVSPLVRAVGSLRSPDVGVVTAQLRIFIARTRRIPASHVPSRAWIGVAERIERVLR